MLSPGRQSARMSKITNDGLTRSGTGRSCTHMETVGVKGLSVASRHSVRMFRGGTTMTATNHDGHSNDSHNHDSTKSKPKQTSTANEVTAVRIEPEKALFWSSTLSPTVYSEGDDHA